jgi:peptide/nickel transport system substrate-binding protein
MRDAVLRRAGALVVAAVVTAAVVGCGPALDPDDTAAPDETGLNEEGQPILGGRLVFGLTAESSGWSPVSDQWALDGHFVASAIYDPLMAVAPDRRIVPELAEVVEHNADFTRWTLHLREGVRFHDGTLFDAAAVKANLDASRSGLGAVALQPVETVEVVDRFTVAVDMTSPWSAFPATLAGQQGYMAAPRTLADGSASTDPVGTGPFVFDRWVPDGHLEVSRNDHYWQHGKPYLDGIQFRPIVDNTSRRAALFAGSLDMMFTYEPNDVEALRSTPGNRVLTDLEAEETVVVLNEARPPFDQATARRAIAYATDQAQVTASLGAGVLQPADGPFTDGEVWYSPDNGHRGFDLARAKAEADAYRAETGQPLRFRLSTFPDPTRLRQAQLLQQMWAAIGAEVRIETLDQASFIKPLINGELEAAVISNFGTADPDFNYLFWHSSLVGPPGALSINFSHTVDPGIDAALDAARRTADLAERAQHYREVTRRLNERAAYVWLYRTPTTLVADDRVRGLSVLGRAGFARPDGKPWLAHLWIG